MSSSPCHINSPHEKTHLPHGYHRYAFVRAESSLHLRRGFRRRQHSTDNGSVPIVPREKTPDPKIIIPPAVTSPSNTCFADEWNCQNWSSCSETGRQTRSCSLKTDCPAIANINPIESQVCPGLKCGNLSSLSERVQCRLKLSDAELKKEFEIQYFPEYCRAQESEEKKQECITLYRSFSSCWKMPIGDKRLECVKKTIGYHKSLESEQAKCAADNSAPRKTTCQKNLSEKKAHFILFQMYDYEFQAESFFRQKRATLSETASFDVMVEETKQQTGKTSDPKLWDTLLKKIKDRYQKFQSKLSAAGTTKSTGSGGY